MKIHNKQQLSQILQAADTNIETIGAQQAKISVLQANLIALQVHFIKLIYTTQTLLLK